MKLLFLFIIFFTFVTEAYSANTKLKKYEKYSDQITWKNTQFKLPKGEWVYYSKEPFHLQNFSLGCIKFINIQNKIINGAFSACYITSGGKWRQALGAELRNEWQNNKYDSCNLRPEYFYVKAIFKGASSNCFIIAHYDPNKELYCPDDPTDTSSGGLKSNTLSPITDAKSRTGEIFFRIDLNSDGLNTTEISKKYGIKGIYYTSSSGGVAGYAYVNSQGYVTLPTGNHTIYFYGVVKDGNSSYTSIGFGGSKDYLKIRLYN